MPAEALLVDRQGGAVHAQLVSVTYHYIRVPARKLRSRLPNE